jgi:hypothetical protein
MPGHRACDLSELMSSKIKVGAAYTGRPLLFFRFSAAIQCRNEYVLNFWNAFP